MFVEFALRQVKLPEVAAYIAPAESGSAIISPGLIVKINAILIRFGFERVGLFMFYKAVYYLRRKIFVKSVNTLKIIVLEVEFRTRIKRIKKKDTNF